MSTDIAPLPGNLPASPLPFGSDISPTSGTGGLNPLTRLISALKRFKWLILALTILGAGGGYFMTRFMPETYVVSGTIILEERGGNSGPVEGVSFLSGSQWIELLNNPKILDPVVTDLKLYLVGPNPGPGTPSREGPTGPAAVLFDEFDLAGEGRFTAGEYEITFTADGRGWELRNLAQGPIKSMGTVGDSAGGEFGFVWVPRPRQWMFGTKYSFTVLTPREVSGQVSDALGTRMARNSRFVTVSYSGTDGQRARQVLNTILRRFVSEAASLKRANLVEATTALDSQLISAKARMDAAQFALQNFKVRTATQPRANTLSPGSIGLSAPAGMQMTGSFAYGEFLGLRNLSDSLQRERSELQEAMGRVRAGELAADQMLSIGVVRGSSDLQRIVADISRVEGELRIIRTTAGPENPNLLKKQQELSELRNSTLPTYLDAVIAQMTRDIDATEIRIATAASEMRDIPQRTITEQELMNTLELARQTHANVNNRAEQARLQEASSLPDVRVLNEAVAPLRPTKNRKSVIIMLGLMGGLGLGLGLAFVLDLADKRFRYADQVTSGLGLSILGVVPEIKRAKGKSASPEEAAQVVEAFRTIRLNLSHVFPENGAIALTITSPMPGDGKSLVSSNLALSFAEAGYRTILVDGDTRRGELHRTFGTERRPGLLDHLAGDLPVADTLRETSHPKLTLLPAGSRHRNAPELMGSRRMHDLMAEMRQDYEVVIIDSPPLAAGIDPFVLGTVTGNLMMVVRAGATERDLAEAKLQIIDRLPIRLVGAVLNDVSSSMDEYKYYAYSYGYGTTEEDEALAELPATTVSGG